MAWYLNNATGGNSVINIPSVTVGNNIGDYIEIKAAANSGNVSGIYRVVGISSGYSALIGVEPAKLSVSIGSSNTTITAGYTQPAVGEIFTVKLRKSGTNQYTASMNGVDFAPFSAFGVFTINQLFRWATESTGAFKGGIYYVEISTNGGASATRYYDPSASGGTGTVLPDTVNSANNGTQAGTWPANDSEWVFYNSGGTYTLTADGATFSYSGAAANTLFNRQLPSDGATYSYSGGAASTLYNRRLSADGAVYAYSGGAAATLYNRRLSAAGGMYSYSGAAATLTYTAAGIVYTLNADGAVFGYTGAAASLLANRLLPADGGSFTYSGGSAEFDFNGYPQADANAYVVSYRIAGDTVLTASISESTRFSAIISQSTNIKYMVN